MFSVDDDQEGVMDNLLEALKTGSAFNVNRERKEGRRRTPRAAGGKLNNTLILNVITITVGKLNLLHNK